MVKKNFSGRSSSSYSYIPSASIRSRDDVKVVESISTIQSKKRTRTDVASKDLVVTSGNDNGHIDAADFDELCRLVSEKVVGLNENDLPFLLDPLQMCLFGTSIWSVMTYLTDPSRFNNIH